MSNLIAQGSVSAGIKPRNILTVSKRKLMLITRNINENDIDNSQQSKRGTVINGIEQLNTAKSDTYAVL